MATIQTTYTRVETPWQQQRVYSSEGFYKGVCISASKSSVLNLRQLYIFHRISL